MSEESQRFVEDYQPNYYSVTELAERFGISRKTAYKWINRFKKHGQGRVSRVLPSVGRWPKSARTGRSQPFASVRHSNGRIST